MDIPKFGSKAQENDFHKIRIESLNLSTRTENALLNANVRTIGGIIRKTEFLLLDIQGLGESGLRRLKLSSRIQTYFRWFLAISKQATDETPQTLNSNLSHPIKDTLEGTSQGLHLKIVILLF